MTTLSRFSLCFVLLFGGCLTLDIDLDTLPPDDWPVLDAKYYVVPLAIIAKECPNVSVPVGCAVVDFDKMECYIYTHSTTPWVVKHEEQHCLGRDHYGESTMRDAWKHWKERHDHSS